LDLHPQAGDLLRRRGAEEGGDALFALTIVFVCIAGGLSIVGLILWLVYVSEKKRTEVMKAVATEIGLNFSATKDEALLAKLKGFSLFNKGHSELLNESSSRAIE
jgi:hypothetical protein